MDSFGQKGLSYDYLIIIFCSLNLELYNISLLTFETIGCGWRKFDSYFNQLNNCTEMPMLVCFISKKYVYKPMGNWNSRYRWIVSEISSVLILGNEEKTDDQQYT